MDHDKSVRKTKATKKCVIKRRLKFLNNKIVLKSQQRFKRESHNVYTEEISKAALSTNYHKRLQTFTEFQHIHMEQMLLKYVKC